MGRCAYMYADAALCDTIRPMNSLLHSEFLIIVVLRQEQKDEIYIVAFSSSATNNCGFWISYVDLLDNS
jgi:hypothetical protein